MLGQDCFPAGDNMRSGWLSVAIGRQFEFLSGYWIIGAWQQIFQNRDDMLEQIMKSCFSILFTLIAGKEKEIMEI